MPRRKGAPAAVPAVQMFAPAFLADCAGRWNPATRRSHADSMNRFGYLPEGS